MQEKATRREAPIQRIRTLATRRALSFRFDVKALSLLTAGLVLGAVVSAQASTLVNGLYVFVAGDAARADEINHNFAELAQANLDTDVRVDELEARIDARLAALDTKVPRVPVTLAQGPTINVPKNTDVLGTATCPAGTRPIAGFTKTSHPYCSAIAEEYIEGNSWKIRVKQAFCLQSYHGGIDAEIWAVCIPS